MDHADAETITGKVELGTSALGTPCICCGGKGACLLCVAAELEQVRTRDSECSTRVVQLECALLTARAEAVLLRRLLSLVENQRSEDLVTLAQIEETCASCGYEPDGGQPVALWIASTLESQR